MSSTVKYTKQRVSLSKEPRASGLFQYSPLESPTEQIRLLQVHRPSSEFSTSRRLICRLHTFDRSTAPQYNAISYTWGDPKLMRVIHINGHTLMVRKNCHYALSQVRFHLDQDSYIWIDAVCINQDDTTEESGQVSIMSDIFAQADCVFACIGPMTDSTACVFDAAEEISVLRCCAYDNCRICTLFYSMDNWVNTFNDHDLHAAQTWLQTIDAPRLKRVHDALRSFGANQYWNRLWIIQELSLARNIVLACGRRKINWLSMLVVRELFCRISDFAGHSMRRVVEESGIDCRTIDTCMSSDATAFSTLRDYYWHGSETDLVYKLSNLDQWQCTDVRDRIYGLLRLIPWPDACGPPVPDYNINAIDLAIDVTKRLAYQLENLEYVEWLLSALRVDYAEAVSYTSTHNPQKLGDTATALPLSRRKCIQCVCSKPHVPRIAIEDTAHLFATVYSDNHGALHATMWSADVKHDTRLETYLENGRFVTVGCLREASDLLIISTSALREADMLLSTTFCNRRGMSRYYIIVREAWKDYYEVIGLGEVPAGGCVLCGRDAPCQCLKRAWSSGHAKEFRMYFDAEDAVGFLLSITVNEEMWEQESEGSYITMRIGRTRFSSFAVRADAMPSRWDKKRKEYMINGVPSLDQRSIICARCGGLFAPDLGGVS